ncbi:MAG TPA: Gfo/Idh/MocA family oxidoreductase [Spirochaetia bacterium]|nr:Gfo/Idh/MocA family oxidoreductase [Spirochaetia bacterium]
MSREKVRVGIIGAGFIGRIHARMFSQVAEAQVVGITDFSRGLAQTVAVEFGVPRVFATAEELIDSDEIDAVIIGVPNAFHHPLALHAFDRGKHVLLEKPMALSGAEARDIYEAGRKAERTLMIAHHMRWEPLSRQAHAASLSGDLGNVYFAKASVLRKKGIPGWGSWFTRKKESGGGPLIDVGVHFLDLCLWLMGSPRPSRVFGATYAKFGPKKRGIGTWGTPQWDGLFDVEDLATAMIRFENGATLNLEASWAVNITSEHTFDVHVAGDEGGISLSDQKLVLTGQKFDRSFGIEIPAPVGGAPDEARLALSRHFIECVRERKKPISDGVSGLINSTVLDAIYRSAETGGVVDLEWDFLDGR